MKIIENCHSMLMQNIFGFRNQAHTHDKIKMDWKIHLKLVFFKQIFIIRTQKPRRIVF